MQLKNKFSESAHKTAARFLQASQNVQQQNRFSMTISEEQKSLMESPLVVTKSLDVHKYRKEKQDKELKQAAEAKKLAERRAIMEKTVDNRRKKKMGGKFSPPRIVLPCVKQEISSPSTNFLFRTVSDAMSPRSQFEEANKHQNRGVMRQTTQSPLHRNQVHRDDSNISTHTLTGKSPDNTSFIPSPNGMNSQVQSPKVYRPVDHTSRTKVRRMSPSSTQPIIFGQSQGNSSKRQLNSSLQQQSKHQQSYMPNPYSKKNKNSHLRQMVLEITGLQAKGPIRQQVARDRSSPSTQFNTKSINVNLNSASSGQHQLSKNVIMKTSEPPSGNENSSSFKSKPKIMPSVAELQVLGTAKSTNESPQKRSVKIIKQHYVESQDRSSPSSIVRLESHNEHIQPFKEKVELQQAYTQSMNSSQIALNSNKESGMEIRSPKLVSPMSQMRESDAFMSPSTKNLPPMFQQQEETKKRVELPRHLKKQQQKPKQVKSPPVQAPVQVMKLLPAVKQPVLSQTASPKILRPERTETKLPSMVEAPPPPIPPHTAEKTSVEETTEDAQASASCQADFPPLGSCQLTPHKFSTTQDNQDVILPLSIGPVNRFQTKEDYHQFLETTIKNTPKDLSNRATTMLAQHMMVSECKSLVSNIQQRHLKNETSITGTFSKSSQMTTNTGPNFQLQTQTQTSPWKNLTPEDQPEETSQNAPVTELNSPAFMKDADTSDEINIIESDQDDKTPEPAEISRDQSYLGEEDSTVNIQVFDDPHCVCDDPQTPTQIEVRVSYPHLQQQSQFAMTQPPMTADLILPRLRIQEYVSNKYFEQQLSPVRAPNMSFEHLSSEKFFSPQRTADPILFEEMSPNQSCEVPFAFCHPVTPMTQTAPFRSLVENQTTPKKAKIIDQEVINSVASLSRSQEIPGIQFTYGAIPTQSNMCELNRGAALLRSSSYDQHERMIQEKEQALHDYTRETYRYSKKPGGFWRDRSQEFEFSEELNRQAKMKEIVKRFHNTNSSWLLRGPYLGTGRYKKHIHDEVREKRNKEKRRFNVFLKAPLIRKELGLTSYPNTPNKISNQVMVSHNQSYGWNVRPPLTTQTNQKEVTSQSSVQPDADGMAASKSKLAQTFSNSRFQELLIEQENQQSRRQINYTENTGSKTTLKVGDLNSQSGFLPPTENGMNITQNIDKDGTFSLMGTTMLIEKKTPHQSQYMSRKGGMQGVIKLKQVDVQATLSDESQSQATARIADRVQFSKRTLDLGQVPVTNSNKHPQFRLTDNSVTKTDASQSSQLNLQLQQTSCHQQTSNKITSPSILSKERSRMRGTGLNSTQQLHKFSMEILDVQVRLPQNIYSHEDELSISFAMIYFDGRHSLPQIANSIPKVTFSSEVKINSWGQILLHDKPKINLFSDVFALESVQLDEMNYLNNQYLVEIEVVKQNGFGARTSVYLRYVTLNHVSQAVYPRAYITILKRMVAQRAEPLKLDWCDRVFDPSDYNEGQIDQLFDALVNKEVSFAMLMKKNPKLYPLPMTVRGIIMETPKGQLELLSINQYAKAEQEWVLSSNAREPVSKSQLEMNLPEIQARESAQGSLPNKSNTKLFYRSTYNTAREKTLQMTEFAPRQQLQLPAEKFQNRFRMLSQTLTDSAPQYSRKTSEHRPQIGGISGHKVMVTDRTVQKRGRYDVDNKQSLVVNIKSKKEQTDSEQNFDKTFKGGATLKTEGTILNFDNLKENNTDDCLSKKIETNNHISINTSENISDGDHRTITDEPENEIVTSKKKLKDTSGLSNPLLAPYFESQEAGDFDLNSEGEGKDFVKQLPNQQFVTDGQRSQSSQLIMKSGGHQSPTFSNKSIEIRLNTYTTDSNKMLNQDIDKYDEGSPKRTIALKETPLKQYMHLDKQTLLNRNSGLSEHPEQIKDTPPRTDVNPLSEFEDELTLAADSIHMPRMVSKFTEDGQQAKVSRKKYLKKQKVNVFGGTRSQKGSGGIMIGESGQVQLANLKVQMEMSRAVINEIPEEVQRHTNYSKMTGSNLSKQISGGGAFNPNSSSTSFHKRQTEKETRAAKTQIGFGVTQHTQGSQAELPQGVTPSERFNTANEPTVYASIEQAGMQIDSIGLPPFSKTLYQHENFPTTVNVNVESPSHLSGGSGRRSRVMPAGASPRRVNLKHALEKERQHMILEKKRSSSPMQPRSQLQIQIQQTQIIPTHKFEQQ